MPRLLTAAALVCGAIATGDIVPPSDATLKKMFKEFQVRYKKTYADDAAERFMAFRHNVLQAYAMNLEQGVTCADLFDDPKCVFGVTKFSDMGAEEFARTRLGYKRHKLEAEGVTILSLSDLPQAGEAVDWRTKGAVTEVKDQGTCGSCWAFSATEEIESAVFMATGKLPVLSTQQIISCDKTDKGCDGGDTVTAYKYVTKAGGIDTDSDYPDESHETGETGRCSWDKEKAAQITGYTYAVSPCDSGSCKSQDEDGLATALASKGPISVCVNAGGAGWQSYRGGVYKRTCSGAASALDHCVQLVGYDKSGETPYWIVRNSWNTDWGIDGYMHLAMGKNLCGIADEATIVQATAAAPGDELVV